MKKLWILLFLVILCFGLIAKKQETHNENADSKMKPLITFVELGSVSCVPCKQMQPIMKAIEEKYAGKVKVVFYDVYRQRAKANEYYIKLMPTQVFLDEKGREFWRHEGFYPQKDIEKILDEKLAKIKK